MGVRPASGNPQARKLAAGIPLVDEFLEGGLPRGAVIEWGVPLGRGGRELMLPWLARATTPPSAGEAASWVLWAYCKAELAVYPPAWQARGVALERVRFAAASAPLAELRSVFMEPFFRLIVLDAPRSFTDEDCAFVARQARLNDQVVMVARDGFLGPTTTARTNVWARLRLNAWYDPPTRRYCLQVVRGLSPRQLVLPESELGPSFS